MITFVEYLMLNYSCTASMFCFDSQFCDQLKFCLSEINNHSYIVTYIFAGFDMDCSMHDVARI